PLIVPAPEVECIPCGHTPTCSGSPDEQTEATSKNVKEPDTERKRKNYSWSELLKRVFELDILICAQCGGPARVIATIHPPEATRKILECLGLPSRPPPITPAHTVPHFDP